MSRRGGCCCCQPRPVMSTVRLPLYFPGLRRRQLLLVYPIDPFDRDLVGRAGQLNRCSVMWSGALQSGQVSGTDRENAFCGATNDHKILVAKISQHLLHREEIHCQDCFVPAGRQALQTKIQKVGTPQHAKTKINHFASGQEKN